MDSRSSSRPGGTGGLELVATLRELGFGLAAIERIVDERTSLAEAVDVHAKALDAEIRMPSPRSGQPADRDERPSGL